MRRSRLLQGLAALALLVAAVVGVVRATRPAGDLSLQQRVEAVSAGLRCPTCAGESVATSRSDSAQSMRAVVQEQLTQGRSPEQVHAWFAQRYGDWILLDPPTHGISLGVWVLPVAVLLAGLLVLLLRARRGRAPVPEASAAPRARPRLVRPVLVGGGVLVAACFVLLAQGTSAPSQAGPAGATAVASAGQGPSTPATSSPPTSSPPAGDPAEQGQRLEAAGEFTQAADAYGQALRERPDDPQIRLRLSFVLLRDGRPALAAETLQPVLAAQPDHPQALLLLGLSQRAEGQTSATATLQHFLAVAPDDPAAGQVRGLLAGPR